VCPSDHAGVSQDIQAAFEWYEFAAEGGLAAAQNNLGQLLLQGPGGGSSAEHEAEAAVRLFQAAADQGSSAGWQNLGVCHELGFAGQGPDSHAAEACYRQAGTAKALLRLGQLLLQQRAHAAARRVLVSAAEAGSPEALLLLAKLHDAQQPGDCQYAQEQLGWSTALCSSGSGLASGSRGGVLGAHKAISTASLAAQASADVSLQLHKAAALAGAAESQHVVACSCWSRGQVQDAMQSWHAAAAQGYGPALLCLGALTETGSHGVHRDPPAARACYAKAAAAGSKQAAARLAVLDQDVALRTNNSWLQSS
jgi:TPR repeat protein